ncbi:hypothetical protein RHMOL_Rhmol09G0024500 [Rhododendron molle]|uniref:Uncharacterized protein n=2 Tax=Rhododendron molle TaxID=49168 RepID=A0ACC0MAC5_RHOML|nr:hypothetical protein RHMOL_Rhmol09G0024500 [Rhododendron molle]
MSVSLLLLIQNSRSFACPNILVKGTQNVVVDFIVFDNEKFMLLQALDSFIVMEREGLIIACAALFYSLEKNVEKLLLLLFLLNAVGKDRETNYWVWFVRRGFSACSVECIPEEKRKKIYRSRESKY